MMRLEHSDSRVVSTPMSTTSTNGTLLHCEAPDCGREFESLQGLNVHRTRTHGLEWLSEGEAPNDDAPDVERLSEAIVRLLEVAFPSGVPVEKLEAVMSWREQTLELFA